MKLGIATCGKIAEAIVGEGTPFPNRSISQLEKFLHEHDIDDHYRANDSKHKLASRAIRSLDTCDENADQLHETLVRIIEELAGDATFTRPGGHLDETDQREGQEYLKKVLAKHGLEVRIEDGEAKLRFSNEIPLSKGAASVNTKSKFVFAPRVFRPEATDLQANSSLVAVMMPFETRFDPVIASIRQACENLDLQCQRADDIWKETTIIDEIFALICKAGIVVCDMSGRNPNVLYEMGIAQTLGKPVVMITQSADDIPFDVKHQRFLPYLNNREGREAMREALEGRLETIWSQEFGDKVTS